MSVTRLHRVRSSGPLQDRSIAKAYSNASDSRASSGAVEETLYLRRAENWVFAIKRHRGRKPYWGQAILRKYIRPVAHRVGTQKRFGWHTFLHSYSTLLRSVGTEFKVMQELLRHSTLRSTLDVYTQAVTPAKHAAQAAMMSLVFLPIS
jgi:site-specific recombinase XerD